MIKIYSEEEYTKVIKEYLEEDNWNFPIEELDYLLEEHNNESFILIGNRLYEIDLESEYTIWFCRIISKDDREDSKIGGLEYMKELYNNIPKKDLKKYAKNICQDFGYIYGGISDKRYCLFEDSEEYCLFFEEELED